METDLNPLKPGLDHIRRNLKLLFDVRPVVEAMKDGVRTAVVVVEIPGPPTPRRACS
jgi:hypothetical protein